MTKILSNHFWIPEAYTYKYYTLHKGYETAKHAITTMKPLEIQDLVKESGLRGRGGAGFPTGLKWSFMPRDTGKPHYLCVNADESEPGTFKDRAIMEWDPHMLIEGILISSYALEVHKAFIYIRGEFCEPYFRLQQAVDEAYEQGVIGEDCLGTGFKLDIIVHRGAGAYICGEETALLESLEGKRGYPRIKPPFPAVKGLFQCPTIINNVESIANVPWIVKHGADAYKALGTEKSAGTRLFSLSGHVNKRGVYEEELGIPLMTMLNERGGGIRNGNKLKAVIPGGSSTPVFTAEEAQSVNLDYESVAAAGSMFGSAGIIVMDETTCMVKSIVNLLHFYMHESCGQCTPCREGTGWLYKMMREIEAGNGKPDDLEKILDIADNMEMKTVCPLAAAATMPTNSYISKFRDEFEAHIKDKCCPFKHERARV